MRNDRELHSSHRQNTYTQLDDFHGTEVSGWYGCAFLLALSSFQSAWRTYLASTVVFEHGSLICCVARGNTTFIVDRALADLGGGSIIPGSFSTVAFIAVPEKRATYAGLADAA
ncbi:hypothetical protein BOTCAL_0625g00030 [Botryotinia calthae]|uniref:Major facilitator superfamily (MFS) profile domain-containing protein n=1 Tax=Botryotinia calthae TaxID=38488 RepID=A0A4Y8CKN4_9HELO|nr:hypothetical protein BOTCAL_0625g00030 [Botryotinia calthae]